MTKGEIIAALVALGFKGQVGPMGCEDPILEDNKLILYSQLPECGYIFNDDGSIDCFYPDKYEMYNSLVNDCGMESEDAEAIVNNPAHYKSFKDLCAGDDGWFFYFEFDHQDISDAIKAVAAIKEDEE